MFLSQLTLRFSANFDVSLETLIATAGIEPAPYAYETYDLTICPRRGIGASKKT